MEKLNFELIASLINGKKQIKNVTEEDIVKLFPLHISKYIMLNEYFVLCLGNVDNKKQYEVIKILSCEKLPFHRKHIIQYKNETVEIPSFKFFRDQMLMFQDSMSFLKSSYMLHPVGYRLIRLDLIKNRVALPMIDGGVYTPEELEITLKPMTMLVGKQKDQEIMDFIENNLMNIFHNINTNEETDKERYLSMLNTIIKNIRERIDKNIAVKLTAEEENILVNFIGSENLEYFSI